MPIYDSVRGEKTEEGLTRPSGRNTIVTICILGPNGVPQIAWGDDYEHTARTVGPAFSIGLALRRTLSMGRTPLLWTFAQPDSNYTELKFGFDEVLELDKIGHASMTAEATIAGEITPIADRMGWVIDNYSGAWGAMGGNPGKTAMLRTVAQFMTKHCGIIVSAGKALSRNAIKRGIQMKLR